MAEVGVVVDLGRRLESLKTSEDAKELLEWVRGGGLESLRKGLDNYLGEKVKTLPEGPPSKVEGDSKFFHLVKAATEKECNETKACVEDVVASHDQAIGNYIWLQPKYGKVLWIDFEEPVGSGKWRTYDRYWWGRHACVVDHDPDKLFEEHVREFVNPKTKSISLLFWFLKHDGQVYSMAPNEDFYRLEAEYFKHHKLCTSIPPTPHKEKSGPESVYPKFLGGHHE